MLHDTDMTLYKFTSHTKYRSNNRASLPAVHDFDIKQGGVTLLKVVELARLFPLVARAL